MMKNDMNISTINSQHFYGTYHGHKIADLYDLLNGLKIINPLNNYIYLAGDSSLDNKYWLENKYYDAVNGYDFVLKPPIMKADINYHINNLLDVYDKRYVSINCAVEESTIEIRKNGLLEQDKFIHNNIQNDDILVVSIGGNDIALKPSFSTIWNMGLMMYLNGLESISNGPNSAWGMKYFIKMFRDDVKKYVLDLIGDKRPKKIIVCMIYFPDEKLTGSWADKALGYLGYNDNPEKLQEAIRQIFKYATSKIKINGSQVIGFPMYSILDGKNSNEYVQRVEPSNIGGKKLAEEIIKIILK